MADVIKGTGKDVHIIDFSSQVISNRRQLYDEYGVCIKPGYISSLYAVYAHCPAPAIFHEEHVREVEVLQLLTVVTTAITTMDYTPLIDKVEVETFTGSGSWHHDEEFRDRPPFKQVANPSRSGTPS